MAKQNLKVETGKLIIELDQKKCISCGTCVALAPKTFEQDNNFLTKIKASPTDTQNAILQAAQSCAVEAITLTEKSTGKKLHLRK